MNRKNSLIAAAILVAAGLCSVGQASAKAYIDGGFVADGVERYENLSTTSTTCAADNFVVGTNDGLVQSTSSKLCRRSRASLAMDWSTGNAAATEAIRTHSAQPRPKTYGCRES